MSELITTQQAARILEVGDRTVINWTARGILPKPRFKVNGRLKFSNQEIEDFKNKGRELRKSKPKNIEVC